MFPITRSSNVKDVIHVKVKKYAGYFNPESKSFAVDPHLTTFDDLQNILIQAFSLNGPFHITYLCRDDVGENVYLSMLTDWDLDAAFMTSSDPFLRLKLDAEPYKDGLMSKLSDWEKSESPNNLQSSIVKHFIQPMTNSVNTILSLQNTQRSWSNSLGFAFNKLTVGLGYNPNIEEDEIFFPSKPPLDDVEFRTYLDENGVLVKPEDLRLRVYHGGVAPALRKVVWRMLLNIFPIHLTGKERIEYMKRKTSEYEQLRSKWQAQADLDRVKQLSNMVWKDVLRTDRTHPYYSGADDNPHTVALMNILTTYALTHPKVSYCQGMSDIVSPILVVMNNEAQAYICFCGAMTRIQENFSRDGLTMSTKFKHLAMLTAHYDIEFFNYLQLLGADTMFFCYRWLLLELKREFNFEDAITVLEVMWSSLPPQPPENDLSLHDEQIDARSFCDSNIAPGGTKSSPESSSSSFNSSESVDVPGEYVGVIEYSTCPENVLRLRKPPISAKTSVGSPPKASDSFLDEETSNLPPPEDLGCGNPFLLFICLTLLLEERDKVMSTECEYDDLVMHFDRLVRGHSPRKVLSKSMKLFAEYLRSESRHGMKT
uniref:TBC1 domain family member 25-like n=1 Tax=Ciona intestinalis TaxID=7719 RepID=UPI000180BC05|nr:TBC1 domain family member 25-like [Ciona intestinalis]|eukprot:XP_002131277.1 TBC1 domain family member 25-like [Ciona intestinalis]